jgi:hypothetical protein
MDKNTFDRFPAEGLIKTADKPISDVETEKKVRLNRKGNELFNRGDIESARRIFQTTGYSDGLIRVGERYMSDHRPVDALKMYLLAHDGRRSEELIEKMAFVIQNLLREEKEEAAAEDQK